MTTRGRQIVLAARPKGKPELADFRLEETAIPTPAAGQLLLGVQYLSLDHATDSLEEADHTRLHLLRLRGRTLCRLPARGWCGRRRGSHSLPRGHRRRSRKRARRFHRNAGGTQLRQAHRPGGRLNPEMRARPAEARQRTLGGETCDIHLFPPLSLRLKGVAMGRWLLAQKASAVRVAESSVPSRTTKAPAHVGRAGRAGVVLIEFSNDRRGA